MVVQVCFPMHLYGKKHLKILFSKTEDALWLNLCIYYWEHLHVCSGYVTQVSKPWPVGLLFLHCELCHFSTSIYRQRVPLVSATPLTVLYWSFWNFAYVFFMVWGCLDIIVRCFLSLFPHCELSHFSPFIYKQLVPLMNTTPLTVLYRLLWNFVCVFFMVWGCACGLDVIVRLLFSFFFHIVNLVIYHPQYIDRRYLVSTTPLTILY